MFTKTYNLTCRWYGIAKKLPKPDRYTLGNQIFTLLLELLVRITKAEYLQPIQKRVSLVSLSPTLTTLTILIRLSKSIGILEMRHYIVIEEQLNDIGNNIGAWIHSLPEQQSPHPK